MRMWSAVRLLTVLLLALGMAALSFSPASAQGDGAAAPMGVTLDKGRQTITSALRVDLTRDFATLPLHKGTANGTTVWFVITDVSDAGLARELGVNHSAKLSNVPTMCPACSQEVMSDDPVLGRAPVQFQGAPDFSPMRMVMPSVPSDFPPQSFNIGAVAGPNYSPFVTVQGSDVVYNAPIVATGDGPFDVTTHTNTHDRTLGIDTAAMTTDLLFVRGFAGGAAIAYLSFDSSDAFTATLERSTFVPALADLQFPNGAGRSDSARAAIFTFVNARTGLEKPSEKGATQSVGRSQGLTHALSLDIVGRDAAVANSDVLEGLQRGADVSNIFDVFPTSDNPSDRAEYSPAWDLQVGVYSDAAVAEGQNGLQTDSGDVRRLAAAGTLTAPGGLPLGSANIVINCPALATLDSALADGTLPSSVDAGTGGQAGGDGGVPVPALLLVLAGVVLVAAAGRRLVRPLTW